MLHAAFCILPSAFYILPSAFRMCSKQAMLLHSNASHGDEQNPYSAAVESQGEEGWGVVVKGVEDLQITHVWCSTHIQKPSS